MPDAPAFGVMVTVGAVESGLLDETFSTGDDDAFAGFGATLAVTDGGVKSNSTDVPAVV